MRYVGATTLMTSFGELPDLAPWHFAFAAELGDIPRLSQAEQRVGLHASKQEDLNKSPVFGRGRLMVGLPAGFVAELGYTPPIKINGAQPLDLFAVAIGRRIFEHGPFTASLRLFGQHGRARGDITCPAQLAGVEDLQQNPYGCRAPSRDVIQLDYYGGDLTAAWTTHGWQAYAGIGVVRSEFTVHVDAFTFDVHDRSELVARGSIPFATIGVRHGIVPGLDAGVEVMYAPLLVQRSFEAPLQNDSLTSIRLQLRYRFG